jgi:hypothetical protein
MIGLAQRGFNGRSVSFNRNQSDADAYPEQVPLAGVPEIPCGLKHFFGDRRRFVQRAMLDDQREFIATDPGQRIAFTYMLAVDLRQLPQQIVAGGLAACVVDDLELVQIQIQQRRGRALGLSGPLDRTLEPHFEFPAIDQPGQFVVRRLKTQPVKQLPKQVYKNFLTKYRNAYSSPLSLEGVRDFV